MREVGGWANVETRVKGRWWEAGDGDPARRKICTDVCLSMRSPKARLDRVTRRWRGAAPSNPQHPEAYLFFRELTPFTAHTSQWLARIHDMDSQGAFPKPCLHCLTLSGCGRSLIAICTWARNRQKTGGRRSSCETQCIPICGAGRAGGFRRLWLESTWIKI